MKKYTYILVTLCLFHILLIRCQPKKMRFVTSVPPKQGGYVPDAKTASSIAEAICLAIYGESIYNEQPFKITLEKDSIWHIQGTFNKEGFGGVATVKIRKADAKVLYLMHGK